MNQLDTIWLMQKALDKAIQGAHLGEVPVGAICVNDYGRILGETHNLKESSNDPCGHAEVLLLRKVAAEKGDWRLSECSVIVTLEPCPMCFYALIHARIKQLIFGAYDPKGGCLSLGYSFHRDNRLNHHFEIVGGVLHYECSKTLSYFFKQRRLDKLNKS